eukprot:COSAG04_NODE_713_length_10870_cov_3.260050_18_plen_154_part_01
MEQAETLGQAMADQDLTLVRRLLGEGANPNHSSQFVQGFAPLFAAAQVGDEDGLSLLLAAGADVRHANASDSSTALHRAAEGGHFGCLELLVVGGADAGARTSDGFTAQQIAEQNGREACRDYLATCTRTPRTPVPAEPEPKLPEPEPEPEPGP